jgi:hypothetical protein
MGVWPRHRQVDLSTLSWQAKVALLLHLRREFVSVYAAHGPAPSPAAADEAMADVPSDENLPPVVLDPTNHNPSLGIYCIVRPITTPHWEYTVSFDQSQPLNENVLYRPTNHNPSMRMYCIVRPITTPQ